MNPPSAWAVAKRDAPQVAEQCWTHGFPVGPKGRFAPYLPYFWSIWNFSKNKEAAKSLLVHLSQAGRDREDGGGERRLRPAGVREADHAEDLGGGRPAEGHALPLSESPQAPDAFDLGFAGAAEDRPADLHAGDPDQDVRALSTRAKRWKRRWPGRKASSKASCGAEATLRRHGPPIAGRGGAHPPADTIGSRRHAGFPTPKIHFVEINLARKMHHG